MKLIRKAALLFKSAAREWSNDKAPRLGASLSYYTIFSLAPVLLMVVAVAGLALGPEAAQGKIVAQLSGLLGVEAAKAIQTMLEKASPHGRGIVATVIGFVTLIVGATGVMIELQDALNTVWKVVPKPGRGIKGIVRDRLLSFGIVLGFGFLLLVSLVLSAAVALLDSWIGGVIPGWVLVGYVLSYGLSLGLVALVLAAIFKVLPDVKIAWRDVWVGALVTSVLFHLGKFGISLYISKASVASTFGAAGSLAVLLVWVVLLLADRSLRSRVHAGLCERIWRSRRRGRQRHPGPGDARSPAPPWRSRSRTVTCRHLPTEWPDRRAPRDGTELDKTGSMKIISLCLVAASLGCATAQPLLLSDQQRKRFEDVVRDAETAGAAEGPPLAAARLADARSEFEYSQHLPMYPDRARLLVAKAQADAELALQLAQSRSQAQLAARGAARHDSLAGAETP